MNKARDIYDAPALSLAASKLNKSPCQAWHRCPLTVHRRNGYPTRLRAMTISAAQRNMP
jgi:hypothetical protein